MALADRYDDEAVPDSDHSRLGWQQTVDLSHVRRGPTGTQVLPTHPQEPGVRTEPSQQVRIPAPVAPAGWYPVRGRPDLVRYHDGYVWTDHYLPARRQAPPASHQEPVATPRRPPTRPVAPVRLRSVWFAILLALVTGGLSLIYVLPRGLRLLTVVAVVAAGYFFPVLIVLGVLSIAVTLWPVTLVLTPVLTYLSNRRARRRAGLA